MPPNTIPGFYYDESKKRYFRVPPNHMLLPDSPYSQRKAREEQVRKSQHEFEERRLKQRIQRSKVLGHPLIGNSGLRNESEGTRDVIAARNAAWAQGLESSQGAPDTMTSGGPLYDVAGPKEIGSLFAYDDATGVFVVAALNHAGNAEPHGVTWSVLALQYTAVTA